ncbi:exonuclease SbcCD subunit D [Bacilli bacterium]|uniref:exonuclease SbcCD subunit D n=1 Tax=Bacillaceae TaxID=186817 RepID=UPI0006213E5E|nr:exonuclease SbcCD subunit D [Virgibacillus sp. SK37]KKE78693.1 DNA repair exonuclease [Bacilli bacterium VT-13-104]PZD83726.1 exonuclease SbcCD subunit D [Bacilli bacterium]PZD84915.1 exonuclease SbcCD subunit D [Bacilli bacterium]PZD87242.1 exonuclease SbcCD subunit D [Bacilli bacterium]RCO05444.1 exonuclease SbcCD subunit D [Bacilli bacterium]
MKFFHTADWHLGKLVQGVYMTDDQRFVLKQFVEAVEEEKPDVVIIAGDLYDRAVPPTEAVHLLDEVLETIVIKLNTPVLAVAGNHDSPGRLNFGSSIMKEKGFHIIGNYTNDFTPVVLNDEHGEVHFHLVPYCDPSVVRRILEDDEIRSHDDATKKTIEKINEQLNTNVRHVYVGHAFVTPFGEEQENTSESERPLSIGGAEYVDAHHFKAFHYTALGHLHQAHYVMDETVRYSGSILKYSISEENHKKGFLVVDMDKDGNVSLDKRLLTPRRDIRTVEATMEDLLKHPVNEDYVFVRLLDTAPVLSPMEKVRSVYPNAMHVERKNVSSGLFPNEEREYVDRSSLSDFDLFQAFYKEVKGQEPSEETEKLFKEVLDEMLKADSESQTVKKREPIRN